VDSIEKRGRIGIGEVREDVRLKLNTRNHDFSWCFVFILEDFSLDLLVVVGCFQASV
jgi:hypothetical protein